MKLLGIELILCKLSQRNIGIKTQMISMIIGGHEMKYATFNGGKKLQIFFD